MVKILPTEGSAGCIREHDAGFEKAEQTEGCDGIEMDVHPDKGWGSGDYPQMRSWNEYLRERNRLCEGLYI